MSAIEIATRRSINALFMATCLGLTAGCAVTQPAQIQSSDGAAPSIRELHLIAPDPEQIQVQAMHSAMQEAFANDGVTISSEANVIAELAIAQSPSSVGIFTGKAGQSSEEPRPIADARKAKWLDRCKAVRVQASLAVFERESGNLMQRSKAESTICEGKTPPYQELAAILIRNLASN